MHLPGDCQQVARGGGRNQGPGPLRRVERNGQNGDERMT